MKRCQLLSKLDLAWFVKIASLKSPFPSSRFTAGADYEVEYRSYNSYLLSGFNIGIGSDVLLGGELESIAIFF